MDDRQEAVNNIVIAARSLRGCIGMKCEDCMLFIYEHQYERDLCKHLLALSKR